MIINPGVDVLSVPKPTAQQEVPSLQLAYSHQHASHEIDRARYLQRLQTLDSGFTCDRASQEGQRRRPSLSKSYDPADATSEQPAWENTPRFVHHNGIYRPKQDADERNGHCTTNKGRDEPYHELETTVVVVESVGVKASQERQEESEPYSEEHVNEYRKPFAYLWGHISERQTARGCTRRYLFIAP